MKTYQFRISVIAVVLFTIFTLVNHTSTASAQVQPQVAQGWQQAFALADRKLDRPSFERLGFATATSIRFNPMTPKANVPFTIIVQVASTSNVERPAGTVTLGLFHGSHDIDIQTAALNRVGAAYFPFTAAGTCYTFGAKFNGGTLWSPSQTTRSFCFEP